MIDFVPCFWFYGWPFIDRLLDEGFGWFKCRQKANRYEEGGGDVAWVAERLSSAAVAAKM